MDTQGINVSRAQGRGIDGQVGVAEKKSWLLSHKSAVGIVLKFIQYNHIND